MTDSAQDHWADDRRAPLADWRYEVANDDTRLGYHEWRDRQIELLRPVCAHCGDILAAEPAANAQTVVVAWPVCENPACISTGDVMPPPP